MNRRDFDIDHIDPLWEEGRDYQLVCGFEKELKNLREEDPSINIAKSNRFLPWRWSFDELGSVPEEPGDIAMFLVGADIEKDIPGKWVLMEFMSDQWFEASKHTCSLSVNGGQALRNWRKENPEKALMISKQKGLENGAKNYSFLEEYYERNPDKRKEFALKGAEVTKKTYRDNPGEARRRALLGKEAQERWREDNPEKAAENIKKATAVKFMCTVTGKVLRPGSLTLWQRKRGIDPSNRIRLE